jgi:ParB-like chromosome segregation protein Spo0J
MPFSTSNPQNPVSEASPRSQGANSSNESRVGPGSGQGGSQLLLALPPRQDYISTESLRPAKAILELGIEPSPVRLLELERLGETLFESRIEINSRNEIVDGHARWLIAKRTGRPGLDCDIYDYNEEQTLRRILKKNLVGSALSKFCRVEIALKLQRFHERRAQKNRVQGGAQKQLLFLTKAERAHVQELVAQDADVSPSLVRQVKVILKSGPCPELLAALRAETIKINRGYELSSASPSEQRDALASKSLRRSNREHSERLVARHVGSPERKSATDGLKEIRSGLMRLPEDPQLVSLQSQIASLLSIIDRLLNPQVNTEGA